MNAWGYFVEHPNVINKVNDNEDVFNWLNIILYIFLNTHV